MAYVSPTNKTTGDLITAANWNQDIVANSQAGVPDIFTTAGDIAYATAADAATRLAIGAANRGLRVNAAGTAPEWAAGNVCQRVYTETGAVNTGTTAIPGDNTIPQNTEGDQYMTLAITPTVATNILFIEVTAFLANTNAGAQIGGALFQDTTANALAAAITTAPAANYAVCLKFTHRMVAGTTSATTFKFRGGASTGATTTFNGIAGTQYYGGVLSSSIIITEYSA